jgi:hypothetical protein
MSKRIVLAGVTAFWGGSLLRHNQKDRARIAQLEQRRKLLQREIMF